MAQEHLNVVSGAVKIVSVNVGLPREVVWRGRSVRTGIFKEPVAGRVALRAMNFDGDRQADLTVHGGRDKAVYLYPVEHYDYWRTELGVLPYGAFGENLTIDGLDERSARIGDRLRVGSVELVVTQPRLPCFKLNLRFDRADMTKRFLTSRRTGFYCRVATEGTVAAGDSGTVSSGEADALSVADITDLYLDDAPDPALLARVAGLAGLPAGWQTYFQEKLDRHG